MRKAFPSWVALLAGGASVFAASVARVQSSDVPAPPYDGPSAVIEVERDSDDLLWQYVATTADDPLESPWGLSDPAASGAVIAASWEAGQASASDLGDDRTDALVKAFLVLVLFALLFAPMRLALTWDSLRELIANVVTTRPSAVRALAEPAATERVPLQEASVNRDLPLSHPGRVPVGMRQVGRFDGWSTRAPCGSDRVPTGPVPPPTAGPGSRSGIRGRGRTAGCGRATRT
ncbi:MAG: hypothetical protein MUF83_17245 [Acidimicrobiales bacterium]|jgi:hypothetical protein|nr:hypothetical protein [Acidimicrobiales bacterium]